MTTHEALKAEIERFLAITGMSATRFGILAASDPRFVHDLRKRNREPRSPTVRRVTEFMSQPVAKPQAMAEAS